MARVRRTALIGSLAVAAVLLTGCTTPRPMITFYGNRTAVNADAALWCDADTKTLALSCPASADVSKEAQLTLAPGQRLQINVPPEVGETPWVVVFEYLDGAGKAQTGRTEVFTDNRLAYTLPSLGGGVQLTRVEIQSGLVPALDSTGATLFAATRTWVLAVSPKVATESDVS